MGNNGSTVAKLPPLMSLSREMYSIKLPEEEDLNECMEGDPRHVHVANARPRHQHRLTIVTAQKGNSTIAEYVCKMKMLADVRWLPPAVSLKKRS